MKVKLKSIRPLSVLKYVAGSYLAFFTLYSLLIGCSGLAGYHTVRWNGQAITGIWALPCAFFIGTMFWLGATLSSWIALVIGFPVFRIAHPVEIEGETAVENSPSAVQLRP